MLQPLLRYGLGLLLCIVVHSSCLALFYPNEVLTGDGGSPAGIGSFFHALYMYVMVYLLFGLACLFIPPILVFHISAEHILSDKDIVFVAICVLVWFVYGVLMSLLFSRFNSLFALNFCITGLAYGLFYRYYLHRKDEVL